MGFYQTWRRNYCVVISISHRAPKSDVEFVNPHKGLWFIFDGLRNSPGATKEPPKHVRGETTATGGIFGRGIRMFIVPIGVRCFECRTGEQGIGDDTPKWQERMRPVLICLSCENSSVDFWQV